MPTLNSPLFVTPPGPAEARVATSPLASQRALNLSGRLLGARYRLLYPLSAFHGMTVYDAVEVESGRRVAIRLLAGWVHGTMARYFVETRAAIEVRHANIVDILDFGCDTVGQGDSVGYVVMEYLHGESLARTLEFDGPLRWTQVLMIAKQVCLALVAAHAQHVVHGRLDLANCFRVFREQAPDIIKVLDFGAARFACKRTGLCLPGKPAGEPGLVAPELLTGRPFDARVDIYALGLLMYQLTTDRAPYPLLDAALADSRAEEESGRTMPVPMCAAVPELEVPSEFEAVIRKALALDPQQRHVDAQGLYDALVAVEQVTGQSSRLPRDLIDWDPKDSEPLDHEAVVAASSASLTSPDPGESGAEGPSSPGSLTPSRSGLFMRTALTLVSTAAVRTALTALS
jgi:serine/threonine protein kinase